MIKNKINCIRLVNRKEYIKKLCKAKRVLHLGATDFPITEDAVKHGRLLHQELHQVADHLVGMDLAKEAIEWLSQNCALTNIVYGNIENLDDYPREHFDIIIAGEIIEHLSNPGQALNCLHSVMGKNAKIIITVPNAYSLKGFLRAVMKHELIHPDHTLHHSPHTLKTLLDRHGFLVDEYFSCVNGGRGLAALLSNTFLRFNPQLAEGIGVICSPKK